MENGPHGKASPFGMVTQFAPDSSRLIIGGGICVPISPEEAAPYKSACRTTGLMWSVTLNDAASLKLLEEPRIGYCFRLCLTPDGKRFVTSVERTNNKGNPDPKIELRDATDGKLIWRAEADRGTPYGLAIPPNGRLVANSAYLGIDLRDAETGKFLRKIHVAEANPVRE